MSGSQAEGILDRKDLTRAFAALGKRLAERGVRAHHDMAGRSTGQSIVILLIAVVVQFVAGLAVALLGGMDLLTGLLASFGLFG